MNKKVISKVATVVGLVILALAAYLITNQKQVSAPTTNDIKQEQATTSAPPPNFTGNEDAFKNALNLYIQKKQQGVDMSTGPCLGKIAEDWVLDIAHNPRLPVDDEPQNQCAEFRNSQASHFIEFDPDGKLIRSQ